MSLNWTALKTPLRVFTTRNTKLVDLTNGRIVQYFSNNTKLEVVDKCNFKGKTYYRTEYARRKSLDWAFEAAAFGMPNDEAPLALDDAHAFFTTRLEEFCDSPSGKKTKSKPTTGPSKNGGKASGDRKKTNRTSFLKRLFGAGKA